MRATKKLPTIEGFYMVAMDGKSSDAMVIYVKDGKYAFYKSLIDTDHAHDMKEGFEGYPYYFWGPINITEVTA